MRLKSRNTETTVTIDAEEEEGAKKSGEGMGGEQKNTTKTHIKCMQLPGTWEGQQQSQFWSPTLNPGDYTKVRFRP